MCPETGPTLNWERFLKSSYRGHASNPLPHYQTPMQQGEEKVKKIPNKNLPEKNTDTHKKKETCIYVYLHVWVFFLVL